MNLKNILIIILALTSVPAFAMLGGTALGPKRTVSTVAGLTTCNAANQGTMALVTDALVPVALATVAAGGAVKIGVTCDGTNWIVQ